MGEVGLRFETSVVGAVGFGAAAGLAALGKSGYGVAAEECNKGTLTSVEVGLRLLRGELKVLSTNKAKMSCVDSMVQYEEAKFLLNQVPCD